MTKYCSKGIILYFLYIIRYLSLGEKEEADSELLSQSIIMFVCDIRAVISVPVSAMSNLMKTASNRAMSL